MKKDELTALNLTDEQIQQVQALNGRDVNAAKAAAEQERDSYKTQYETASAELKKFEGVDPDKLNGEIQKLNKKLADQETAFNQQMADRDFNDALNASISKAGGIEAKTIVPLLDVKALKESKNQGADIDAAVEAVKKSHGFLFGITEPFANPVQRTDTGGGKNQNAVNIDMMRSVVGLPPLKNSEK